jgi:hypothetical protein
MDAQNQIPERWRYLRDLLIEQLSRFESGALQLHSADQNVSAGVIVQLKRDILEFDRLLASANDGA